MKIFLIGYMGSGKSTIASILGDILNMNVVDTDSWIEKRYGMSITDIFRDKGEAAFRAMETQCLEELLNSPDSLIVATGGGLPCYNNNIDLIQERGISVYLKLSILHIVDRIKDSDRPLVMSMNKPQLIHYVQQHLGSRRPCYKRADIKVWSKGKPHDVAQRIIKKIKKKSGD